MNDKCLRNNMKKKEMEKLENKLDEIGALDMKYKEWNKLDKSKRSSYNSVVFKHDCLLETYQELWRKKKKQYLALYFFKKFQDNFDMHLDFKKWLQFFYWMVVLVM